MPAFFTYGQPSPWGFSPYHDANPVLDFFEDDAWRGTGTIAGAVILHLMLFSVLSGSFIMPTLEPEEPEVIPVQIVTFEAPQPEPEPVAEPVSEPAPSPVMPAPVQAPRPKPTPPPPQPEPEPQPAPPPPQTEPEPEPEPEITPLPPPPEVLAQPVVEPEPEALPEPEIEPLPEPELEPIAPEIVEPDPVIEPVVEPLLEPALEPLTPPEPLPELPPEPEPPVEPEPLLTSEPEIELPPLEAPDPVETELPVPGAIVPEPLPEPVEPAELAPLVQPDLDVFEPPAPEPVEPEPAPEPEIVEPDIVPEPEVLEPDILTAPPTILASPEAPESVIEERRAVPQEQSDPYLDRILRDRPLGPSNPADPGDVRRPVANPPGSLGGPATGGGNIGNPPGGGTQRAVPGTNGWTLAPGSYGNSPGEGYEGLNLDMRCREEFRTHEDCPEYVRKFRGRDAAGFEDYELYKPHGTDRGPQAATANTARGLAGSRGMAGFGSNNVDPGGPSTSLLDDGPEVDFSREFLGNPVRIETDPGRLRDLFSEPEEADNAFERLVLPENTEPERDPSIWPDD